MRPASLSITEIDMKSIKRLILWFQIYSLDITIAGQDECLSCVGPHLQFRILHARAIAKAERTRLRGEYNATFQPGQRRTWTLA